MLEQKLTFICIETHFEPALGERNTYSPMLEVLYVCIDRPSMFPLNHEWMHRNIVSTNQMFHSSIMNNLHIEIHA
jgi:hypothetical protein